MKNILRYIILFIGLIIFFVVSLTLTALIPTKWIEKNVEESAETLYNEEEYFIKKYINKDMLYDNYADAIMINNAYSMDKSQPLYSALIVRRNYIPGITIEILQEEIGDPTRLIYETHNLLDTVQGRRILAKQYSKYWHGYLIILKPLLIFFNYSNLRTLQLVMLAILTIALLYLIYKKIGIIPAIIFLIGFIIVDMEYIYMSLEFSQVFFVMLISSIIMLINPKWIKDKGKIFFVTGMLTCFFDFLTAPLITLGIPLIIYFLLKQQEEKMSIKEMIKLVIKYVIIWGLGYSMTWLTKFILVDILYDKHLLQTGIGQVFHRTLGNTSVFELSFKDSIMMNLEEANISIFAVACILEIIYLIYKKCKGQKIEIKNAIPYLIISIIPIAWYGILEEHSMRHAFFTYRETLLSWIGIMTAIYAINRNVRGKDEKN